MALRRYKITGRGSFTRWELPDGRPLPFGQTIPGDATLVRHEAGLNDEIIMDEATAAKHPDARLIVILDRARIEVRAETATDAPPAETPPAAAPAAEKVKKAKAHKAPAEAPKAEG